jgi:hypothetical protein
MPWNQRFCKDNKMAPWYSMTWNDETLPESNSIVDRIARIVINATDAENYEAPTGTGFDYKSILCDKAGLYVQGSKGTLSDKNLKRLEARNYHKKNNEGDDDYKLLINIREGKSVGFTEMMRFFWRNQASLVYKLGGSDDRADNTAQINEYLEFVHDIMIDFGFEGGNKTFRSKTEDVRHKSNVWSAIEKAFSDNTIGNNAMTEEEKQSAKASFMIFVVKVFAKDLYEMVCDKKGIVNRYVQPKDEEKQMVYVEE